MAVYVFISAPFNPYDNNNPQQTSFLGINNLGQVVGSEVYTFPNSTTEVDGVLYDPGSGALGGYSGVYIPYNHQQMAAESINSFGQIVGWYSTSGGVSHGFWKNGVSVT